MPLAVSALTIGLAGSAAAGERLGRPGALRPDRPPPGPARPGPWAPTGASPTTAMALSRLERVTQFWVHQLLADAPELGRTAPSRARTLAAYRAQLGHRIRYSGPVAPVDIPV